MKKEEYSPYCKICDSCGEELCCSALSCKMDKEGEYCEYYLKHLKFNYSLHKEFIEFLYKDEEANKNIISKYEKMYDIKYDLFFDNIPFIRT